MNKTRVPNSTAIVRPSVPDKTYSDNNPYADFDPTAQLSSWNRLTDALGFTNNAGRLKAENDLNARNWESAYQLSLEDREYNDYASQAERMRAAGYNPDFQNATAGNSSVSGDTAGAPQSREAAGMLSGPESFFSGLTQVMTSVMGMVQGINGIRAQNLATDLDVFNSIKGDLRENSVGLFADQVLKGTDEEVADFINRRGNNDLGGRIEWLVNSYPLPRFMSKKNQKFAETYLGQYFASSSFRDEVLKRVSDRYSLSKKAATSFGEFAGGFVSGFEGENSDATGLTEVMTILSEAGYKAMKLEASAREQKGKYDTDFYTTLKGQSVAGAINAENELNKSKDTTSDKLRSIYDEMVDNLASASRDKNASWLERNAASGALILLYMLSTGSINFSRSQTPKGLTKTFGLGF